MFVLPPCFPLEFHLLTKFQQMSVQEEEEEEEEAVDKTKSDIIVGS